MKKIFLIGFIFLLVFEIVVLILFAFQVPDVSQDSVKVNEVVQTVTRDYYDINQHKNETDLEYVVLDNEEKCIFKTKEGLTESVTDAIVHRDTILDIKIEHAIVGKIIIYNQGASAFQVQKQVTILVLSLVLLIECSICIGYIVYLYFTMTRPFKKLKGFAERVAGGNLDIPLEMDRHNIFGAFTESFDLMRSELKKARAAEAQAQQSKKELVAKLSHDIKTPIASIKAVSEVGLAIANTSKDQENYSKIIGKADQINSLVTNLFTATLEELHQLTVTPTHIESRQVQKLLENADYLNRALHPKFPECLVYADALRLQQVFDNIFANSYKYAKTDIHITAEKNENHLSIVIEDMGGGVPQEELPMLKEKFKRGSNSSQMEGAGLGLYISDYFMKEMNGDLSIENGALGLKVTILLLLSGKI